MPTYPLRADCDDAYWACEDCDARGAPVLIDMDIHTQSDWPDLMAEATANWNRRFEDALLGPFKDVVVSLAAAISLLKASPKTGAPSSKMFNQMLKDYRRALHRARKAYNEYAQGG